MEKIFLLIIFFSFYFYLFSQESKKPFVLNEYSTNINRTTFNDDNTLNHFGFGLGTYINFLKKEYYNFVFGFEYNYTSQEKITIYQKPLSYLKNVKYNTGNISFPLLFKLYLGSENKLFFESSIFADIFMHGNASGYYQEFGSLPADFSKRINFLNNYGAPFGIGTIQPIPIKNHKLIIKLDYKRGLNATYFSYEEINNMYIRFFVGLII